MNNNDVEKEIKKQKLKKVICTILTPLCLGSACGVCFLGVGGVFIASILYVSGAITLEGAENAKAKIKELQNSRLYMRFSPEEVQKDNFEQEPQEHETHTKDSFDFSKSLESSVAMPDYSNLADKKDALYNQAQYLISAFPEVTDYSLYDDYMELMDITLKIAGDNMPDSKVDHYRRRVDSIESRLNSRLSQEDFNRNRGNF